MRNNKITISFSGDFCSKSPEKIIVSNSLKKILENCDLNIINFEGPLAKGKLNIPNNTVLNQSMHSPAWCEAHNFNVISLANNHILDYSEEGLLYTKQSFQNSTVLGVGDWNNAYTTKYIDVCGSKIGFIAATSSDFSALKDKWTDKRKIGAAWINSAQINNLIIESRKLCDYLFIISHGGLEYMDIPLPEWRDRYRELIDLGVDAVVGAHPHVPQGVEVYKDKPIFYSLGNFYFDRDKESMPMHWDNGLIAIVELEKENVTFKVKPTLREHNTIGIDASELAYHHLNSISTILKNEEEYLIQVNKYVTQLFPKYYNWLLNGFNAVEINFTLRTFLKIISRLINIKSKKKLKSSLHQIREESTRWALIRALKLKSKASL